MTKNRLDALTGLRFFAASMVVLHHLQGQLWIPAGTFAPLNLGNGVSFFFCLSGFILHYNYRDKIRQIPYHQFLFQRFFRLWPAHLTALALVVFISPQILHWLTNNLTNVQIFQIIVMQQSLTPNMSVYYAWNGPAWSIATEFWFYAAFPLICISAAKKPAQTVAIVFAFVVMYLFVAQTFIFDPSIRGNAHGLGAISPLPRILEFTAGIAVCEYWMFRKTRKIRFSALSEIGVIASVIAMLWLVPQLTSAFARTFGEVPMTWFRASAIAPAFLLLIVVMAHGGGPISKLLATKPLVWLGDVSFAIYLTHQPIVILLFKRHIANSGLAIWQQVPMFLLITLAVSAAIFYYVEKPGIEFSKSIFRKNSRATKY